MPPRQKSSTVKRWSESNVFWSCASLALGIFSSVVAAMTQFAGIAATVPIQKLIRHKVTRYCVLAIVWVLLPIGTHWLFAYWAPREAQIMAIGATHESIGTSGFHERFTAGECRGGVPEVSQKIQWTWFLKGTRFGCVSNEYESQATIDFEPRAFGVANTHAGAPMLSFGTTREVKVSIAWYSTRADGKVKWALSVACMPLDSGTNLNLTYEDVLTILDSPAEEAAVKSSQGTFPLNPQCTWPDAFHIRLVRHGNDKDDTLLSTAHLTALFFDSE